MNRSAGLLRQLACAPDINIRASIAYYGAIPLLVEMVGEGTPDGKERAASVLWRMARHEEGRRLISKSGGVKALIGLRETGTRAAKACATAALENLALNEDCRAKMGKAGYTDF